MKESNEMRILREFLEEFNPIHNDIGEMSYTERIEAVKETLKEM